MHIIILNIAECLEGMVRALVEFRAEVDAGRIILIGRSELVAEVLLEIVELANDLGDVRRGRGVHLWHSIGRRDVIGRTTKLQCERRMIEDMTLEDVVA